MSGRRDAPDGLPEPDDVPHVPDVVLDELLAAFSDQGEGDLDIESPAIDRMLGLDASPGETPGRPPAEPATVLPAGSTVSPPTESLPAEPPAAAPTERTTIVIGDDDGLPDAVYLDPAAEDRLREVHGTADRRDGSTSGGTTFVLGDELDSSGAFDAVEVPNSSMDPRVRARRVAVKRAEGRRRLIWIGVAVLVVLVAVAVLATLSSSLFSVRTVRVQGATYTDQARLDAVIEEMRGEPTLLVDTRKAERQLETIPWVERAIVTTDFPHTVLVDIRERVPLATYAGSDGLYRVIDRDSRVLDVIQGGGRPSGYMLITGAAPDTEPGALAGGPFAAAAQLAGALPPELKTITASIGVDATTGDLELILAPDGLDPSGWLPADARSITVRLGDFSSIDRKLARLLQVVRDGVSNVRSIDVSTEQVTTR